MSERGWARGGWDLWVGWWVGAGKVSFKEGSGMGAGGGGYFSLLGGGYRGEIKIH